MSRVRNHVAAMSVLIAISGCAAASDISAPSTRSAGRSPSANSVLAPQLTTPRPLLEWASNGLLYTSESDYPFVHFLRARTGQPTNAPLSVAEFRSLLGIAPGTVVEIITLDAFFARHIERVDPADDVAQALIPRYVELRETLRTSLSQVVVYRVGTIAIDCYVVGFNAIGDLEGLKTISIET
jgi:hypothetical protein